MQFARAFNQQALAFVQDLAERYPEDADFREFRDGLEYVSRFTPRRPMEEFIRLVPPAYRAQIAARDEAFFMEGDHRGVVATAQWQLVPKLQAYWRDMGAESRDNIWNYFVLFDALATRYAASADE